MTDSATPDLFAYALGRADDLDSLGTADLLALHARTRAALVAREVLDGDGDGDGDGDEADAVARHLLARAFGWGRGTGCDLVSASGRRVAVRARLARPAAAPGTFARLPGREHPFDMLAAVEFAPDFTVRRAVLLDADEVFARAVPNVGAGALEIAPEAAFRLGRGAYDVATALADDRAACTGRATALAASPPPADGRRRRRPRAAVPQPSLRAQLAASLALVASERPHVF